MKVSFELVPLGHIKTTIMGSAVVEGAIESIFLEDIPKESGLEGIQLGFARDGDLYLIVTRPDVSTETIRINADKIRTLGGSTDRSIRFPRR